MKAWMSDLCGQQSITLSRERWEYNLLSAFTCSILDIHPLLLHKLIIYPTFSRLNICFLSFYTKACHLFSVQGNPDTGDSVNKSPNLSQQAKHFSCNLFWFFFFPESLKIRSVRQLTKAPATQWTLFQDLIWRYFPKTLRKIHLICNAKDN